MTAATCVLQVLLHIAREGDNNARFQVAPARA